MDSRADLISWRTYLDPLRQYGWIAEFTYPDCIKTFNGDIWVVKKS